MAGYQFHEAIPNTITPICESYEPDRHTFADIREDCDSEFVYCASCGCQTQYPVFVGGGNGEDDGNGEQMFYVDLCDSCEDLSSPEYTLRMQALRLRNAYGNHLASEQQRLHLLQPNRSYGDRKYTEATIMHEQCYQALYRMGEAVGKAFPIADNQNDSPVIDILEMRFKMNPWYGYYHCVYVIKTKIGKFVFDPTGAQFGPRWPVFELYKDYKEHRILSHESAIMFEEPLGFTKKDKDRALASLLPKSRGCC